MDGVKWIKIQTDIFDNQKILAIENMPEGDAILVIWLKLLALAGKVNRDGMIFMGQDIPYTDQLLSYNFRRPLPVVQLALATFKRFGMIDIVNDIICVSNWAKYQNVEGLERVREQGRIRTARYRERQKLEAQNDNCDVTCDVTCDDGCDIDVTHPSYIDIETDIRDKDKEDLEFLNSMNTSVVKPKAQKKTKPNELTELLDSYGFDNALRDALIGFIDLRKKKKKPLTPRALKMVITKLMNLSKDVKTQIAIVDQSTLHNWETVYELKEEGSWNGKKPSQWDEMAVKHTSNDGWDGVGHL